jgi:hypothetical protein
MCCRNKLWFYHEIFNCPEAKQFLPLYRYFFGRTFTRTQTKYLFYTFICLSAVSNKLIENKIVLFLLKKSRMCFLNVSVKIVFFFSVMNILLLYLLLTFLCSFRICVLPKGDILGHTEEWFTDTLTERLTEFL